MTEREILSTGVPTRKEIRPTDGDPWTVYISTVAPGFVVESTLGGDGKVFRLETSSHAFATGEGARAGTSVGQLRTLYPDGRYHNGLETGTANFVVEREGLVFLLDFMPNLHCDPVPGAASNEEDICGRRISDLKVTSVALY